MEHRDDIEIMKARFFERYIGDATPRQLAEHLWQIYMTCRSNLPTVGDDDYLCSGKLWPPELDIPDQLNMADVIDKYICRGLHNEINELAELAGMKYYSTGWVVFPALPAKLPKLGPFEDFDEAKAALAAWRKANPKE